MQSNGNNQLHYDDDIDIKDVEIINPQTETDNQLKRKRLFDMNQTEVTNDAIEYIKVNNATSPELVKSIVDPASKCFGSYRHEQRY